MVWGVDRKALPLPGPSGRFQEARHWDGGLGPCRSTCFHLKPPQPLNQWTARIRLALGCERSGQYSWLFPNTMLKDGKISDFPAVLTACWRCAWGAPGVRDGTWFRSLCAYWRGWQLQKVGFMKAKSGEHRNAPKLAFNKRRWTLRNGKPSEGIISDAHHADDETY